MIVVTTDATENEYDTYTGLILCAQIDAMAGEYHDASTRIMLAANIAMRQAGEAWQDRLKWARQCMLEAYANERDTQEET